MPGSKLLEKLVRRDELNTMVVNLYPGDEGFTLALRSSTGDPDDLVESFHLPYEVTTPGRRC